MTSIHFRCCFASSLLLLRHSYWSSKSVLRNTSFVGAVHGFVTPSVQQHCRRVSISSSSSSSSCCVHTSQSISKSIAATSILCQHSTPMSRQLSALSASAELNYDDTIPIQTALCQFLVTECTETNLETCSTYINKAVSTIRKDTDDTSSPVVVVLPEIWNSPYATSAFEDYAEVLPDVGATYDAIMDSSSPSVTLLCRKAEEHGIWLIGGSIPEVVTNSASDTTKLLNTCLVFNPEGTVVAKHSKVHLFDVDVPDGITFFESDTLSPGNDCTFFDITAPDDSYCCRVGVGICYDVRFPEYSLLLSQQHGCHVLVYPGAFNTVTGPAHWELLQRARAVDSQCYVLTASPARSTAVDSKYPPYAAWGHSSVVTPWGDVVATTDECESIVYGCLDMQKVTSMRQSIPVRQQKRTDLYTLTATTTK